MPTYSARAADVEHKWYVVDASGQVLGRLASEVAKIIRGKHKPTFTPHMDTGDNVIVINAAKVRLTGRKSEQKVYFSHSGYMGHETLTPFAAVFARHPERVVERAVHGMLPKNALARQKLRLKLRVYAGEAHPHAGQQPVALVLQKKEKKSRHV
jgi:large subunit ribosomal protein L13